MYIAAVLIAREVTVGIVKKLEPLYSIRPARGPGCAGYWPPNHFVNVT
jgi:hypothetical protein